MRKLLYLLLLLPAFSCADPYQAKKTFLERNPEIIKEISDFALSSVEREKMAIRLEYQSTADFWITLHDKLGNTNVGSSHKEIKDKVKAMMEAHIEELDKVAVHVKKGTYLFMLNLKGENLDHGYVVLNETETIAYQLLFGSGRELN